MHKSNMCKMGEKGFKITTCEKKVSISLEYVQKNKNRRNYINKHIYPMGMFG